MRTENPPGLRPGIDTKIDGITTTTDRSSVQFMVPTADTPTLPKSSDILLARESRSRSRTKRSG